MGETDDTQTGSSRTAQQTVLVVDDERHVADLYSSWLAKRHEVRTAYGGEEALEKADADVDVIFLDRRMPDMSGDEVLERVRERGLGCRVVMVTAVDPDFDIVEMPFDDYLTKPVEYDELDDIVENMQEREAYTEVVQEYLTLTSKKAALEAEVTPSELVEHEEYQELVGHIDELAEQADADLSEKAPGG